MFFSKIAPIAALVGAAAVMAESSPAVCDLTRSWDEETLFKGVVGFDIEADADIELDLSLDAQIEGEISLDCLPNFTEDPAIRIDLAGIKAYVEVDLSASASLFQTVELIASSELNIDVELLEVELEAAFALDLLVSVSACVDLTAGFYVSFGAGDFIDVSLSTKEVVSSKLDGLLAKAADVKVGAEVDLSAAIEVQLGLRLRSQIGIDADVEILDIDIFEAGAEVALWIDLFTYSFVLIETDNCILSVNGEFFLALGIAVNLDVEVADILDISIAPEISIKLAAVVQAEICLPQLPTITHSAPTLPTPTPTGPASTDGPLVTSTLTTTKVYTITSCHVSVPNCPATQTQVVVTSVVESTVTVCPANQTPALPTSATAVKPVPTITETLTTVVPCEPTTSTVVVPPEATAPAPTVTITQAPSGQVPSAPAVTAAPGTSAPSTPGAEVPSAPGAGAPVVIPSYPAPNNTFTSIAPPAAQPSTWVPPTTAPSEIPQAGAASLKAGLALAVPALVALML